MLKVIAFVFAAAFLVAPAVAFAECGSAHSTKSVDASTPDQSPSIADSSAQQSTKPDK